MWDIEIDSTFIWLWQSFYYDHLFECLLLYQLEWRSYCQMTIKFVKRFCRLTAYRPDDCVFSYDEKTCRVFFCGFDDTICHVDNITLSVLFNNNVVTGFLVKWQIFFYSGEKEAEEEGGTRGVQSMPETMQKYVDVLFSFILLFFPEAQLVRELKCTGHGRVCFGSLFAKFHTPSCRMKRS